MLLVGQVMERVFVYDGRQPVLPSKASKRDTQHKQQCLDYEVDKAVAKQPLAIVVVARDTMVIHHILWVIGLIGASMEAQHSCGPP